MTDAHQPSILRTSHRLMVIFFASGFVLASWGSRLPAIARAADLDKGQIGLVLLAMSGAMIVTMLFAERLLRRCDLGVAIRGGAALVTVAIAALAFEPSSVPVLGGAVLVIGMGSGICDLAMNVAGTGAHDQSSHTHMPLLHGMFSLGTVVGAVGGTIAAGIDQYSVRWHLPMAAILFGLTILVVARNLGAAGVEPAGGVGPASSSRSEWRNRRTVSLGIVLLGMAFAEGTANEWLPLVLVGQYGFTHSRAAAGLVLFVSAMTATRFAFGVVARRRPGPLHLRRRYDVLLVLGSSAVLVGSGLVILGGSLVGVAFDVRGNAIPSAGPLAVAVGAVGVLLWGVGASLSFPLSIAAAAEPEGPSQAMRESAPPEPVVEPVAGGATSRTAASVSVVTTMGYTAALAGPPLIGTVADHTGYLGALSLVPVVVVLTLAAAAVCHPRHVRERTEPLLETHRPSPSGERPPRRRHAGLTDLSVHEHLSLEPSVDVRE